MDPAGLVTGAVLLGLAAAVLLLLAGRIGIILEYFRDNKSERALLKIKGRGFAYTYKTSPALLIKIKKDKLLSRKKARKPGKDKTAAADAALLKSLVPGLPRVMKAFIKHTRWKRVELRVAFGSGDAAHTAIMVGLARALGENLRARVKRHLKFGRAFGRNQPVMAFNPCYNGKSLRARLQLEFQIRLYVLLGMFLYLFYQARIKNRIKRRR